MYAKIAPLIHLIEFVWIEECQMAYDSLKKVLAIEPILTARNWDLVFHVHIDTSNFSIGCMLAQIGEQKLDHPICFTNSPLNKAEKNYTATERGVVHGIRSEEILTLPFGQQICVLCGPPSNA